MISVLAYDTHAEQETDLFQTGQFAAGFPIWLVVIGPVCAPQRGPSLRTVVIRDGDAFHAKVQLEDACMTWRKCTGMPRLQMQADLRASGIGKRYTKGTLSRGSR